MSFSEEELREANKDFEKLTGSETEELARFASLNWLFTLFTHFFFFRFILFFCLFLIHNSIIQIRHNISGISSSLLVTTPMPYSLQQHYGMKKIFALCSSYRSMHHSHISYKAFFVFSFWQYCSFSMQMPDSLLRFTVMHYYTLVIE